MQILEQKIKAKEIVRMVDARLEKVQWKYIKASADGDKKNMQIYADVKWELAELKMQLMEVLLEQITSSPENIEMV